MECTPVSVCRERPARPQLRHSERRLSVRATGDRLVELTEEGTGHIVAHRPKGGDDRLSARDKKVRRQAAQRIAHIHASERSLAGAERHQLEMPKVQAEQLVRVQDAVRVLAGMKVEVLEGWRDSLVAAVRRYMYAAGAR